MKSWCTRGIALVVLWAAEADCLLSSSTPQQCSHRRNAANLEQSYDCTHLQQCRSGRCTIFTPAQLLSGLQMASSSQETSREDEIRRKVRDLAVVDYPLNTVTISLIDIVCCTYHMHCFLTQLANATHLTRVATSTSLDNGTQTGRQDKAKVSARTARHLVLSHRHAARKDAKGNAENEEPFDCRRVRR